MFDNYDSDTSTCESCVNVLYVKAAQTMSMHKAKKHMKTCTYADIIDGYPSSRNDKDNGLYVFPREECNK